MPWGAEIHPSVGMMKRSKILTTEMMPKLGGRNPKEFYKSPWAWFWPFKGKKKQKQPQRDRPIGTYPEDDSEGGDSASTWSAGDINFVVGAKGWADALL